MAILFNSTCKLFLQIIKQQSKAKNIPFSSAVWSNSLIKVKGIHSLGYIKCTKCSTVRKRGIFTAPYMFHDTLKTQYQNSWWKTLSKIGIREMSEHNRPITSKFTEDIDLDQLREEINLERKKSGQNEHLFQRLQRTIAEKSEQTIANLNEQDTKKLKILQLEHNFLYSEGYNILSPEEMSSENWLEAMNGDLTKNQRLKFYLFLQKRQMHKKNAKLRKAERKEMLEKIPKSKQDAYEHGRIFMRVYDSTMKKWSHHKLSASMQFGIPLVLDMDYESYMRPQDIKNTALQLLDLFAFNRADEGMPFHLHFTSCHDKNAIYRLLQIQLQNQSDFLATVTEKSYLDVFEKKSLVYLSPNGRQVLREFDPNSVYIVGAFNDKAVQKPISYARAKEQKVRCMRLPLDEHLHWVSGSKELTLDQVMRIMLAVKNNKSWKEAFKVIPQRKLMGNK